MSKRNFFIPNSTGLPGLLTVILFVFSSQAWLSPWMASGKTPRMRNISRTSADLVPRVVPEDARDESPRRYFALSEKRAFQSATSE